METLAWILTAVLAQTLQPLYMPSSRAVAVRATPIYSCADN